MIIMAPISVGELVDKTTILLIKQQRILNQDKLKNINNELAQLLELLDSLSGKDYDNIQDLFLELKDINTELWDIENYKRACEQDQNFGEGFVNAARQVYLKNDERARVKREINRLVGSDIVEEKSY